MHEKQFLSDISNQNFHKYKIVVNVSRMNDELTKGKMFILTRSKPEIIYKASLGIFDNFFSKKFVYDSLNVHLPVLDSTNEGKQILTFY